MSSAAASREESRAKRKLEGSLSLVERDLYLGLDGEEAKHNLEALGSSLERYRTASPSGAMAERAEGLIALARQSSPNSRDLERYKEAHGVAGVARFFPSTGDRVYRLRVETFPGHVNYLYFIAGERAGGGEVAILWDVGSGTDASNEALASALQVTRTVFGEEAAAFDRLTTVAISHAHIDHFGGAGFVLERAPQAGVSIHELDARVIEHFEERVVVASKDVAVYLARSGIGTARAEELESMYRASKELFRSVPVRRRLRHGQRLERRFELIHTPGHCPGHLCLRVGDHLLVADQVLDPVTPNIPPQSITAFTGLENYIRALMRLRLEEGVTRALPAHYEMIEDLGARIDAILEDHRGKLERVMSACTSPRTLAEIAEALYGKRDGYDELLALLEAGAHVEYLNQLAHLRIANLEELARERDPVLRYVAR